MRTRTSIAVAEAYAAVQVTAARSGFLGVIASSWPPTARSAVPSARCTLAQRGGHRGRHEIADVAAERRHLLHAGGREEAVVGRREHVHRLDVGGELAVQLVHL